MPKRAGRKSKAQTPAPRKERIYGSKKNPKGSAASEKSASKIKLDDKTMTALKNKLKEFKEKHPNKKNITLNDLKAVYRRGAGAYSKSHRPTITGGAPNTRNAWSMARVNKFLKKAGGAKVKAAYVQDDDLMKMEGGGSILLAPNGEPSNLNSEQWHLVRTPQFKAWFGDWENDPQNASKVVDENGEPLVVYRGVKPVFKYEYDRKNYLFFTSSVRYANVFGKDVKAFFLNIRKPLDLEYYNTLAKNVGVTTFGGEGIFQIHKGFIDEKWVNELMILDEFDGFNVYEFEDNLKNSDGIIGYDVGNYGKEKVFVIGKRKDIVLSDIGKVYRTFEKNSQAKLADGTNNTFDPSNPDIRYEDGGLIAPNGKPSNLTPEQYNLVRTPEFKAWFGDWENDPQNASKVVDENGEPLVCYHGTDTNFTVFDKRYVGSSSGEYFDGNGFYFTSDYINAKSYADYYSNTSGGITIPIVYSCFLNLKNPLIKNTVFQAHDILDDVLYARNHGYDGYIVLSIKEQGEYTKQDGANQIVAFEPEQIKLADGTNTTFDPNNEDIRFEEGGLIAPNGKKSNLTLEQYKLVRTPQFKAWFGDWENDPQNASKVVDWNGEPLVVYHGSSSKFNKFDKSKVGEKVGREIKGFYFSDYEKVAELFTYHDDKEKYLGKNYIRPFFLNVRKLLVKDLATKSNEYGYFIDKLDIVVDKANKQGYDGVLLKNIVDTLQGPKRGKELFEYWANTYVVFEPNNIKLADGRNKAFDPNNEDIRYKKGGQTFNDKELLAKWKRGESIGFTATAHLKAKGLIPRNDGTKRKSPLYKKEGGLVGGYEDLTDEWLSKKIEIFLDKVKPIKYYFVDPNTNTLTVGFDKYYSQDAAQKVYEEATSSKEFFHAPSVESTYDSKTGDLVFKIKLKKAVEYSKGGSIVYSAIFFDENEIVKRYGQVHPNLYSHHSTIEFKPQSIGDLPIGDRVKISIVGRLTTDKVDVLLVNNPFSKNKYPHITLSTSEGVKPFESNKEIEQNIDKVEPLNDYLEGVVGYFDGSGDITKYNNGGEIYEDDEYYEKTDWQREQEMLDNSLVDLILHDENYALNLNDRYILSHEKNIEFRNKEQDNERDYKPRGLWYAFNYEWASWVYHEMPRYARDYDYVHKIEVTDKVLRLDTIDKCIEFTKKYGIPQPWGYRTIYKIDWIKVAEDYSGIEVTQPYKWSRIHEHEYTLWWLYGWDVGSGCVWNEDGVKSIELVHSYANGGEINELENYLRNIRIDPTWGDWGKLYRADFGENGVISWEITQSYFDEDAAKSGYDPNNPEFVIVQSMDRDRYGDTKRGIEGSKGEGAKAIASLFLKFSNLKEILYDDYSEGFWQKIGGSGDVLKREDFFKYFNQKNKTNYFNKGGKIKSITDVDDVEDYVPIFIDENVPTIPEDPFELYEKMEDYLGLKIVKSLLKKSNIPINVLGIVGKGYDGVAFETDNGTILKVTKNGEEAMNSFLVLKNYDNLEGQAKIHNLFIISNGTQKLYFIEKDKLRVAANEMSNFPLDYYDELWRVGQKEDEEDFEYWVKDLAKDWESENNQSVSSKEMKQAFDVVDLSHRIVKDMDVYDLEVNDATPHNVGYFDDDLYCFDCAASNDKILARGGNMKYAKGGEIEFEYLREAEREEVEDFFDGEPNEIARWSEGKGRGITPHTIYNLGTVYLLQRDDYGFDTYESTKYYFVSINESFARGGEVDEEVIKERWAKKKDSLMNMADNIRSLRTNLRKDLKGDDEKDRLTALAISLMDKTAERVGNDESESNGHLGITGLSKRNIKVEGNTITLKYIGKSGVKHEKQFSDEGIANALKDAIANSQSKYVFETSDGFRIKNDRINRYLSEYDISAKDLRGYSANQWIVSKLREVKDKDILGDEAKRKKKFNEIVKSVAEKVGHGAPTLKKHYMLPSLEREWVNNGKIVDLANIKRAFEDGGEINYARGGSPRIRMSEANEIKDYIKKQHEQGKSASWGGGNRGYHYVARPDGVFLSYDIVRNKYKFFNDIDSFVRALYRLQVRGYKKGGDVGVGKINVGTGVVNNIDYDHLDESQDLPNDGEGVFKKGGDLKFNDIVLYHEKKGNWFVAKNTVYAWLYQDPNAAKKLESGEFEFVLFPPSPSIPMAMSRGYVPPLLKIWTKKYQKETKGADNLLGIVKGWYDEDNKKLYILMMTTRKDMRRKGVNSHIIKNLREEFNLDKDQIIFDKPTKEGEMFSKSGKYDRGGEVITYSTKTNEYYDRENKKWVIEPFTIKKGQLIEYSHSDGGRVEAKFLAKAGEKKAKIEILHGYSPWTKRVESTQYVNPAGRTEPAYFLKDIPRGTIKTVSVDFIEPVTEKTFELRAKPISRWLRSPEFKEAFGHLDNPTTMAKGGEISDEDKKETYKKWKSLVNMSKSELEKFYNSEEGKVAGLTASQAKSQGIDSGRESARWIMKMKDTSVKDWTPTMWKWAKKQISFISRMSGNKGKLYDESGEKTRKHTSLLIWGHNPNKKAVGGELDIPLKENAMNEITYNELPAIDELPIGKTFVLKEHYYNNQNGKPTHQGCRYLIVENMGDAQMDDCLKLKVHQCYGGGGVTTRGIITRPIKNIMNKGRDIGESLATSISKPFKKGGELDPDKKEIKEYFEHKSGAAGGLLVGKRHSEGGIQAINKSTGQPLEMEGGEVVITRDAVSDSTLHEFNGKQMTNREILSAINESGGGVKFADGGDVSCKCSGKEYKLGGKTYKDYELFNKINNGYGSKAAIEKGMKVEDKEHGETFKMLKNGEITYEQFLKKLVVDHLSENPKYYDK